MRRHWPFKSGYIASSNALALTAVRPIAAANAIAATRRRTAELPCCCCIGSPLRALLRRLEIFQVRRRLVLARRHQVAELNVEVASGNVEVASGKSPLWGRSV